MTDIKSPPKSRMLGVERHQLLVEWNDTRRDYPRDKCAHQLFEEQVIKTPEAFAIVFQDQFVTYSELNYRSNQVARFLTGLGVGTETLVGLFINRSIEMVVGLLGVLKAGAAYVPLDPSYPADRISFMLRDSKIRVVLAEQELSEQLHSCNVAVIHLDTDWKRIASEHVENPNYRVSPNDLAYVIYTSGSTGQPKGTMIEHRGLVNYLDWCRHEYLCKGGHSVPVHSSLSFDLTVTSLLSPLMAGQTVKLLPVNRGVEELGESLRINADFSLVKITPAHLQLLGHQLRSSEIAGRTRMFVVGGEELRSEHIAFWQSHAPDTEFINEYGPTETVVGCCVYRVPSNYRGSGPIPIGRPIQNTELFILDNRLEPVSIGTVGELYIAGDGLARGYLNQPKLTAERFIKHSFDGEPKRRLYKTGDLARYRSDGNIEFIGRADNQIKLRGYRIELGEIENVLIQHPEVHQAAAIIREDTLGDKQLTAYVVPSIQNVSVDKLRSFLETKVPQYMVPAAIVALDTLPLTSNGKIDRGALPIPQSTGFKHGKAFQSPQTATEEKIFKVWAEVLGFDQIGIHDDFFALGGHSLRAIQIIARLRNILNKEIFLSDIFSNSSIAELANILDQRTGDADAQSTALIQPIGRDGHLPLSFSQERAWFIQQLYPSNVAYHTQSLLYFTGRLDVDALERSLAEIVRRHEIYRTTFQEINGNPVQLIHAPFSVSLPVVDLQALPDHEREAVLHQRIAEETQKPFDLSKLPLVRWTLVQLKSDEFVVIHVENHLVHDGWSFNVFRGELLDIYNAFSVGDASPLPEPTLQFSDYAHWQRQWMEGENAKRQLGYWKQQLTGSPSTLALATDYPRPPMPSFRGTAPRFEIPPELGASLRALSQERGVTLFMTMISAFIALLQRYTQQEDICVGAAVGNRRWKESEGLIGMLVNNVVLRTNLAGNPKFVDLLAQVRTVTLDAYTNEDIPFDHVVRALEIARDNSRNPIFQVMFSFHDSPLRREPILPEISFKCIEAISNRSAKFDMNLIVIPRPEQGLAGRAGENGMSLIWEYSSDLFEPATIERMACHYLRLLREISADSSKRLSEISILSEQETQELLQGFNRTRRLYASDKCLHQLFEAQVERTPEAVAVVFEDQQLTYRELNKRANQLGHYLQKLGVGAEVLVGICVERSIEMVVGLLGILKAGGAYVPLDPSYPRERLGFMLEDAQARVLLTQQKLLSSIDHRSVVCLDRDWPEIAKENVKSPQNQAVTENLAYVIYTSGSTGTPKGVMIPHRGLVNYLGWATEAYEVAAGQGAPVHSSIGFDLSITSIFTPLLVGRRVVILPEDHGVEALCSLLRRETDFSLIKITPAHLEVLGQELPANKLAQCARALIIGGEALTFEKLKVWSKHASGTRLINEYGPTETVVGCCVHEVAPGMPPSGPVPIGRPIANTQLYILDRYLQPVPIGVAGELHIGGDGLARGYLNRPELTEEKFIANPFSADPVSRLYKTGDLARYLPDGNIEFLGRMDTQVKIRGYRIELGEIEAVLCQHPAIRDAIVMVREDNPGDKRLVAYVVQHEGASVEAKELRGHLKKKLPDYMVPSAFVFMDALPLTPNGKVDRSGLPMPEFVHRTEFIAPRTSMEDNIAEIWAEVLGLERVGIDDNFFELGGHSLLATQVVSRLRTYFNCDIPLRTLFEAPTVEGLAAMIIRQQASQVSETEMERLLDDVDAMSSEDAEQSYKD